MKKYSSIVLTILSIIIYKIFIIGIQSNETFFVAVMINITIYSLIIMGIPLLLALRKKENYWELVNKYTYYALGLFIALVIVPEIYFKYFSNK